jgi:hypothetical protein
VDLPRLPPPDPSLLATASGPDPIAGEGAHGPGEARWRFRGIRCLRLLSGGKIARRFRTACHWFGMDAMVVADGRRIYVLRRLPSARLRTWSVLAISVRLDLPRTSKQVSRSTSEMPAALVQVNRARSPQTIRSGRR